MFYRILKRAFDIAASAVALIVLLPLWLIAVIGIEVSDPGPVFYMAQRVGRNNRPFRMFKFRSMRVDRSANEKSFKADVNRIFPFGQFMRDTKIDELPQLINVLIGQMSVIGPRPAAVDQMDVTRGGRYAVTAELKPGLSGPSALYDYIYGDTIEDEAEYERLVLPTRLDLDVYYVYHQSVRYDCKMIWYTIKCIFALLLHKKLQWMYDELVSAAQSVAPGKEEKA